MCATMFELTFLWRFKCSLEGLPLFAARCRSHSFSLNLVRVPCIYVGVFGYSAVWYIIRDIEIDGKVCA